MRAASGERNRGASKVCRVPVIATELLTKRYPRVTALDELTVEIGDGITGLVGANGAGKSTLLRILLGLSAPTSGSATVLGHDVRIRGDAVRGLVGYMPEHDCLPPDVTASELVVHLTQMAGIPPNAARERTADVLRHVGLDEERYRPIGGYSTGMRQRVKLAQAIAHDPKLVLLDEPTNGLDPEGRDEMLALVRRIGTEFGIAVLITSHLLGELEHVCDHIVVLDSGRLLRSESTAALTAETGVLAVEVTDGTDRLASALTAAGLRVRPDGPLLLVGIEGEKTYDAVRDAAAELELGLVRMQPHRHRLAEVFR